MFLNLFNIINFTTSCYVSNHFGFMAPYTQVLKSGKGVCSGLLITLDNLRRSIFPRLSQPEGKHNSCCQEILFGFHLFYPMLFYRVIGFAITKAIL